jgi:hypothetical protein
LLGRRGDRAAIHSIFSIVHFAARRSYRVRCCDCGNRWLLSQNPISTDNAGTANREGR